MELRVASISVRLTKGTIKLDFCPTHVNVGGRRGEKGDIPSIENEQIQTNKRIILRQ